MSDLISRRAAKDAVAKLPNCDNGFSDSYDKAYIIDVLDEVPSAEHDRKKGKWIPHEDEDGEHYGDKCSECGEWYVMPYGKTNFCPNCGADMRE